ncbi:MAG: hypothetical protein H7Z43_11380 [Clostridia bacterium]|nr:hypothetical protein [Deltaproteobacteria bacterium]
MTRHAFHRTARFLSVVVLAFVVISCRGCNKPETQLIDLAATDARMVVAVGDLNQVVRDIAAFAVKATQRAGKEALEGSRKSLSDQLGFDPFTANDFDVSGIAASRGAVMFAEGAGTEGIIGLHVANRSKFDAWLKGLVQRNSGADQIGTEVKDGVTLQVASRPFGSERATSLYWAFVEDDVLVTRPEGGDSLAAAVKRLTTRASGSAVAKTPFSSDPTYLSLSSKVPNGDIRVFGRGEPTGADGVPHSAGIISAFDISDSGLELDSFVDFKVPGLAEAIDSDGPLELTTMIESDAVMVVATGIAKPQVLNALKGSSMTKESVERITEQFARTTTFDIEKDVMPLLAGPVTMGVHLTDLTALPTTLARRQSLSALLDFVHVSLVAKVTSREQMIALLDKGAKVLEEKGPKVLKTTKKIGGKDAVIYSPAGAGGPSTIGWGVIGDLYVYGAGTGRLERAMDQGASARADTSVRPKLDHTVGSDLGKSRGSLLLTARSSAIADQVALLGKTQDPLVGAMMPMVSQAIEVLRTVGDIAFALEVEKDGLRVKAREKLQ